jgi:hypothetical protein
MVFHDFLELINFDLIKIKHSIYAKNLTIDEMEMPQLPNSISPTFVSNFYLPAKYMLSIFI